MAGLLIVGAGILAGEVVAIPTGAYVYSNYISKQKTWTAWTIGAVGTAVLFPVITFGLIEAYVSYDMSTRDKRPPKDTNKKMGIQPP